MKIFVVENHPDTLKYLKMYLESVGHTVSTATTMKAALAASSTETCHVLLSDLGLPDGDGWQLMEQAIFPQPIYAVAMSGFASASDIARSKAAGFHRHIAKPFGEEDILEALEEAVRQIEAGSLEKDLKNDAQPSLEETVVGNQTALVPYQIANRLHQFTCQKIFAAQLLLRVMRDQIPEEGVELKQMVGKALGALDEAGEELNTLMGELRENLNNQDKPRKSPQPTISEAE